MNKLEGKGWEERVIHTGPYRRLKVSGSKIFWSEERIILESDIGDYRSLFRSDDMKAIFKAMDRNPDYKYEYTISKDGLQVYFPNLIYLFWPTIIPFFLVEGTITSVGFCWVINYPFEDLQKELGKVKINIFR